MSSINLISTYPSLVQFGILATGVLTGVTGPITVNKGFWYGSSISPISPETVFISGIQPSGQATAGTLTINALAQLSALITEIGTVTSNLTNFPIITQQDQIFLPNRDYTGSGIAYTNKIIKFIGNSSSQFFITIDTGLTFSTSTFIFEGGASPCNVFWLVSGGFASTGSSVPGVIITNGETENALSCTAGALQTFSGHLFSSGAINLTGIININSCSIDNNPVCYLKGTQILTKKGFIPIEDIRAGDKVVTKGKIYKNQVIRDELGPQLEPVFWVSKFKVTNLNSKSRPICIKKDTLGKNKPFKDLYVSPGHSLLLNNKMVLAKDMVNGTTIYQDKENNDVEYYHLECERHSAIFANGILAESYLDVNNRDVFENSIRLKSKFNFRKFNFLKM